MSRCEHGVRYDDDCRVCYPKDYDSEVAELRARIEVLEAQVTSLQMSMPRGIHAAEPSCDPGPERK